MATVFSGKNSKKKQNGKWEIINDNELCLSSILSLRTTDELHEINLLSNYTNNQSKIKPFVEETIDINGDILCKINNILTKNECNKILKKLNDKLFQSMSIKYEKEIRNSDRFLNIDTKFADLLWNRLKDLIYNIVNKTKYSIIPLGFNVINKDSKWKLT